MMTKINLKWLLMISVLTAGAPIWFISYNSFATNRVIMISGILTILLALLFSLLTQKQNKKIIYTIIPGFIIATIIKIIIDSFFDPSSHNLLPFEIVYYTIIASLAVLMGVAIGFVIKKIFYR
jgi:hypothetical protein